eukprot:4286094-Amphidinium_carterae.1
MRQRTKIGHLSSKPLRGKSQRRRCNGCEMENAPDALDRDLYVEEKKKEAVALYFRLVVLTDKTALGI